MINRRQFLYLAGASAVNLFGINGLPPIKHGTASTESKECSPDLELSLTATPSRVQVFPGDPTAVWTYKGEVTAGDQNSLVNLDQSYLGPIIRVRKNQKIRIHFNNNLPDRSIIHWHGLQLLTIS